MSKLRGIGRAFLLGASLVEVLFRFGMLSVRHGGQVPFWERARWMHRACSLIVSRLGMPVHLMGRVPTSGLIVSNHLSYLDILFYASQTPCIFVSKSEVKSWPMFGILAKCGGTIFVERDRRHGVSGPAERIRAALDLQIPVVLFPEGTSTDGSTVLPFHSAFLEPAVAAGAVIHAAAIRYTVSDGVEADLCYYGDITFAPHLLGALRRSRVSCEIAFAEGAAVHTNRKEAAIRLRRQVMELRGSVAESAIASDTFV